jgi:hypothetical protein
MTKINIVEKQIKAIKFLKSRMLFIANRNGNYSHSMKDFHLQLAARRQDFIMDWTGRAARRRGARRGGAAG